MKVAYVAGPYRANTPWKIQENVRAAARVALKWWKKGYAVVCPHMNTQLFDGEAPDSIWLEGDLEIMRRCDVVVMVPGWEVSRGATAEHAEAKRLNIPIFEE